VGYFLVTTVHGPRWDGERRTREQDGWDAHAALMDRLVEDGFVILGGPIGDRAMLVVEAGSEDEIEQRMESDPWRPMEILRVGAIEPWTIWLDGRTTRAERASEAHSRSD
jgi:uncharacterized protein YciI